MSDLPSYPLNQSHTADLFHCLAAGNLGVTLGLLDGKPNVILGQNGMTCSATGATFEEAIETALMAAELSGFVLPEP